MAKSANRSGVNWRQAGGEALLIFLGVGIALLGQTWWEYHNDRDLEQHLLRGIQAGLSSDLGDLGDATAAAVGRAAGADELLTLLQDPDAGFIRITTWLGRPTDLVSLNDRLEKARVDYPAGSMSAQGALHMVVSVASMQRLDLSDATFREATASGQLNVIRDAEIRALITNYYFNAARYRDTGDTRVDSQWQDFLHVLAESGLAATGGGTNAQILTALRTSPRLLAELKNVRNLATRQLQGLDRVLGLADALTSRLDDRGASPDG